ncbi:hypothetical protein EVAR_26088_1 [Eumeta japonica]|uniref:Uncharacterized protein n=1 Tax=Eumeta variegata TaxID=151549 RepID=A0A4C1X1C3_EUMVA|nr:hypothetical protein EVAR_26088_1 [Eumeta japonica]
MLNMNSKNNGVGRQCGRLSAAEPHAHAHISQKRAVVAQCLKTSPRGRKIPGSIVATGKLTDEFLSQTKSFALTRRARVIVVPGCCHRNSDGDRYQPQTRIGPARMA